MCEAWAKVRSQAQPDASLLQAYDELQKVGAETMVGQDATWLTNIVTAASQRGCSTPAPLARHVISGWWVPATSELQFHRDFRDCNVPEANVGGCPHAFDKPNGPGNLVNEHHVFDAESSASGHPVQAAASFFGD